MPFRQCDQHLLLQQRPHGEADHIRDGGADERGVDLFVVQRLYQLAAAALLENERNERRHFAIGADDSRHERMEGR
jgi:hypothetical protein